MGGSGVATTQFSTIVTECHLVDHVQVYLINRRSATMSFALTDRVRVSSWNIGGPTAPTLDLWSS